MIRLAILIIIICSVLLALRAEADDYAGISLGMFNNARTSLVEVKLAQIGHRDYFTSGFFAQVEGGGWVQRDIGDGRKSSFYGAAQVGLEANGFITMRVATGPALISTPDSYLGGPLQFAEDIFIGVTGQNGNTIGFKYKHFSSAGLEMPNMGRDFGGLEAGIQF